MKEVAHVFISSSYTDQKDHFFGLAGPTAIEIDKNKLIRFPGSSKAVIINQSVKYSSEVFRTSIDSIMEAEYAASFMSLVESKDIALEPMISVHHIGVIEHSEIVKSPTIKYICPCCGSQTWYFREVPRHILKEATENNASWDAAKDLHKLPKDLSLTDTVLETRFLDGICYQCSNHTSALIERYINENIETIALEYNLLHRSKT